MSRSMNRQNGSNTAKSAGKVSQGGQSFVSGKINMGKTAQSASNNGQGGPNIVIDIESESLTYNQARSIRLQLQRDVEQLRNRVRMLQNEETRAMKKIAETKKKTKELQDLQQRNDNQLLAKQREEQQRQAKLKAEKEARLQRKEKEKQDMMMRNQRFREQKNAEVEEVRRQKEQAKHTLYGLREQNFNQAQYRKQQIREQKQQGLAKQNEFIKQKRAQARAEVEAQKYHLNDEIMNYEKESQELERLENELLRKLQETQVQERAAFQRLENAMVDGSIPPPLRAEQSTTDRSGVIKAESQKSAMKPDVPEQKESIEQA